MDLSLSFSLVFTPVVRTHSRARGRSTALLWSFTRVETRDSKYGQPRPLVVRSASVRKVSLGAQKAQGSHVAVEDVDGQQTALETVQLQRRDVPVLLLVQARPVPEDEHLPVSHVEGVVPFLHHELPGHVKIRQEIANVVKQLVLWVGCSALAQQ